eukprot:g2900.t1
MPKPQFVKYTNGKTALDFKKDGTGIAYYPSGKVAVAVTSPHGGSGRYYNFYLDVTNNGDDNSKASQMLIASFNNEGVGFVAYPNGQPRINITKQGGTISENNTKKLLREWLWITNLDRLKLGNKSIKFRISNALTFECKKRTDIKITFQSFISKTFDVGLPSKRGKTGKAQMTFFERLKESGGSHGGADLEKVQDMNWSLPRLSVSGRETIGILDKDPEVLIRDLDGIRDTTNDVLARVKSDEFKSSITIQTRKAAEAVYEMVHNNGPKVKINFGATYTSEYKQVKRKSDGLVTLPIIQPKKLDDLAYSVPSKRLLTVCLISDKYSESRPGMKMLRWAASKIWRQEKKQLILNEKEEYESKNGKSSSFSLPTSESESNLKDNKLKKALEKHKRLPLNADNLNSGFDFAIVECSKSKLLEKKLNFPAYPMYLMYMGGRLVFAGTRFHRFGEGKDDFYEHLFAMKEEGLLGHFLPEDFKFKSFSAGH